MPKPHCPLCDSPAFTSHRFGLLRCTGCGLIVDPQIFSSGAAERLNEEAFGDTYDPERSFWVRWFNAWKNRRYLGYLRRAGVRGGELLEVGVGSGSFLRAARNAGFSVSGCDLSASLCRRLEQATGIPMHCGGVEALPAGRWDVVVMNHVLEHVHDPVWLLRAARERLRPGGVLHLATPNVACWEARLPGWTSYEPYHLTYFTPHTLRHSVTSSGLAVEHLTTHESFSGWFLSVVRTGLGVNRNGRIQPNVWIERASTGRARSALAEHPYRLAMVCAGGLLWPLRVWQDLIGRGDELVCMARRSCA